MCLGQSSQIGRNRDLYQRSFALGPPPASLSTLRDGSRLLVLIATQLLGHGSSMPTVSEPQLSTVPHGSIAKQINSPLC